MSKLVIILLVIVFFSFALQSVKSMSTESYPYNITMVKANDAWSFASGKNVIVAVIDSGLDLNHPDLYQHVFVNRNEIANDGIDNDHNGLIDDVNGWDYRNGDNNVDGADTYPHGTEMAGIIVQNAPNITILPIRFLDGSGTFSLLDTVTMLPNAIDYAISMNASVILMSFGHKNAFSQESVKAFQRAQAKHITLVSSVGNDGQEGITYPAAYNTTFAIGSVDINKSKSDFSNYGTELDFVAPGRGIYTSDVGGSIVRVDGTSASAASVSALCSLLYEIRPSITPSEVFGILKNTAEDITYPGYDTFTGNGLVNFALATRSVYDTTAPVLLSNNISITRLDDFQGTIQFFFKVQEDSFIAQCTIYYHDDNQTDWSRISVCLPTYLNSTDNILDISFDVPTKSQLFSYYAEVYDIADHKLEIGSVNEPLLIPTNLHRSVTTTVNLTQDIPPSDSPSESQTTTTMSSLTTESDNTSPWFSRTATTNIGILPLIIILPLIALRRSKK